jgi:secreted trypsin-like serine protease
MTEGQGRVVGGTEAKPYEFKWQVVIFTKVIDNGQKQTMICGGSVINDRFILTA